MIRLPDDKIEIVTDSDDLIRLATSYMGSDVAEMFIKLIQESKREHIRAESDLLFYELSLEENRDTFSDLLDDCNTVSIVLQKSRLDRQRLGRTISNMKDKILRQL